MGEDDISPWNSTEAKGNFQHDHHRASLWGLCSKGDEFCWVSTKCRTLCQDQKPQIWEDQRTFSCSFHVGSPLFHFGRVTVVPYSFYFLMKDLLMLLRQDCLSPNPDWYFSRTCFYNSLVFVMLFVLICSLTNVVVFHEQVYLYWGHGAHRWTPFSWLYDFWWQCWEFHSNAIEYLCKHFIFFICREFLQTFHINIYIYILMKLSLSLFNHILLPSRCNGEEQDRSICIMLFFNLFLFA